MVVQLLLADWCTSCDQAASMWRSLCEELAVEFEVLDVERDEAGRKLAVQFDLVTFPAVFVDGKLRAVGVPQRAEARDLLLATAP